MQLKNGHSLGMDLYQHHSDIQRSDNIFLNTTSVSTSTKSEQTSLGFQESWLEKYLLKMAIFKVTNLIKSSSGPPLHNGMASNPDGQLSNAFQAMAYKKAISSQPLIH